MSRLRRDRIQIRDQERYQQDDQYDPDESRLFIGEFFVGGKNQLEEEEDEREYD